MWSLTKFLIWLALSFWLKMTCTWQQLGSPLQQVTFFAVQSHCRVPSPKGCLKLKVDAGFKDRSTTLTVLARNEVGKVQGLWFERASISIQSILNVEAKANFNSCAIAKDKPCHKISIESDCKIIIDTILGFNFCPWFVLATI